MICISILMSNFFQYNVQEFQKSALISFGKCDIIMENIQHRTKEEPP